MSALSSRHGPRTDRLNDVTTPFTSSLTIWTARCTHPLAAWCLFALPFLLHFVALPYPLLFLDDAIYFTSNPLIAGGRPEGLLTVWQGQHFGYTPVTHATIWLDAWLQHSVGIEGWWLARVQQCLWVGLGVLGVRSLMTRLTGCPVTGFVVALLYALHPVCAATSLWLALRRQAVCLALLFWGLSWFLAGCQATTRTAYLRASGLTFVLLLLAGLARFNAVSAMALAPILGWYVAPTWWRQRWLTGLAVLLPGLGLVGLHLLWTDPISLSASRLGGSWLATMWLDGVIVARYLGHALCPWPLSGYYGVQEVATWSLGQVGSWLLIIVLVAGSLAPSACRRRVAWLWAGVFVSLAPTLNLVNQPMAMADHYLQPALPFLLLMSLVLIPAHWIAQRHGVALALVATISLSWFGLSWSRNQHFANSAAFIAQTIRCSPDSALGHAWLVHASTIGEVKAPPAVVGQAALAAASSQDFHRVSPMTMFAVLQMATRVLVENQQFDQAHYLLTQHFDSIEPSQALYLRAGLLAQAGEPRRALETLALVAPIDPAGLEDIWQTYDGGQQLPTRATAWAAGAGLGAHAVANPLAPSASDEMWRQRILSTLSRHALAAGDAPRAARYALALTAINPDLPLAWEQLRVAAARMGKAEVAEAIEQRLRLLQAPASGGDRQ